MFQSFNDVVFSVNDIENYLQCNCKMKNCSRCKYSGQFNCFYYVLYDAINRSGILIQLERLEKEFNNFKEDSKSYYKELYS